MKYMSACLSFEEILESGEPQISTMSQVGESFSDVNSPGACEAFSKQVRLLEGFITSMYRVAASCTRKSDNLDEIALIWKAMGGFCAQALIALSGLKDKYPYCGTPELYDLTLDYKMACDKRYWGALEEKECLTAPLPENLFPKLS
jgi:hypothetical protein